MQQIANRNNILILAVRPTGRGTFRLGLTYQDSLEYFRNRRTPVNILLNNIEVLTHTTCGPPLHQGFDLEQQLIHNWIVENHYDEYPHRHPTELEFEYSLINNHITLRFLRIHPPQ